MWQVKKKDKKMIPRFQDNMILLHYLQFIINNHANIRGKLVVVKKCKENIKKPSVRKWYSKTVKNTGYEVRTPGLKHNTTE